MNLVSLYLLDSDEFSINSFIVEISSKCSKLKKVMDWWCIISILYATINQVFIGDSRHLVTPNINSLTLRHIKQIGTVVSTTICNPDFETALSPVGSQLKISEQLNPNQLVVLLAKVECSLFFF